MWRRLQNKNVLQLAVKSEEEEIIRIIYHVDDEIVNFDASLTQTDGED